ncbi:hypothetical protein P691DRAFT_766345 [Macrolepiota fuliginosa MF-IS2]|uniref:Retrotransposon gag domain-containing protein n=1 Tax=Macrolepiota fuliginosa MF-IS2 TaxID=1400762 RepID=A0A9P5WYU2_9AGAR|nr:hypothetical protein P691DRAFT_766345 [Macrolepiota fuliginosa MF-IS2]
MPLTTSHSKETSGLHSASSDIEIPMSSAPLAELPSYHSTLYLEPFEVLPPATSHILLGHSSESDDITSRSSRSISVSAVSATQQQTPTTGLMEQTVSLLSPEINESPSSSSGEVTPSSSPVLNIPTLMSPLTWLLTLSSSPTSTQMRPMNVNPSTSMIAMIQNTSSRPQGPQPIPNPNQNPQQLLAPQQNPPHPPNPLNPPNPPNPLPMAQPQTAKPLKINPFKGDPCHFQTFQDELRLIFDSYSAAFQDAQGNIDDRKKIIYALQNITNGNAAGFQNGFMKEHWDNTNNCYDYSSWTNFNSILEENFKPKIEVTQAIEFFNQTFTYLLNQAGITDDQHRTQLYIDTIPDWIQQQIFLTTRTPDSYVAWQQDIVNLINNFQKYKLHNSSSKSQTPISFYGEPMDINAIEEASSDKEPDFPDILSDEENPYTQQGISVNATLTTRQKKHLK